MALTSSSSRRLPRSQHLIRVSLAFVLLAGTYFPWGFASAQMLFSRPGAGASRLPLNVMAFDAPGFGDVADAINLANGNLFITLDGLARNTITDLGDDPATLPSDWHLTSRYRLHDFDRYMVHPPDSFWSDPRVLVHVE